MIITPEIATIISSIITAFATIGAAFYATKSINNSIKNIKIQNNVTQMESINKGPSIGVMHGNSKVERIYHNEAIEKDKK